ITGRNRRRQETVPPTPVSDTVVVALQLDAMPMDRSRRLRAIDDSDLRRLVLADGDRRTGDSHRIERRRRCSFLEDVAKAGLIAVHALLLRDEHPQTPPRRILWCEREFSFRQ